MKNSQKDVSMRIRHLISLESMTIQEFSDFIGFPKGTIEKYINSPRQPSAEFLSALYAHLRVSANWVLNGVEPMHISDLRELDAISPPFLVDDSERFGQFIIIPRLDVEASAGDGQTPDSELVNGQYAFNKKWIERRGLNISTLSVIAVKGDSMEPLLHDGDLILIDQAQTKPVDGRIFVARFDSDLFVKRLQRLPGDKLQLLSSNPVYPPLTVSLKEDDQVNIIGRVVASMHEW